MADRTQAASQSAPPTLVVRGTIRDALALDVLRDLTTEDFVRYLSGRRWFAAKAGAPRTVRVIDLVPLDWDDGSFAMSRIEVETDTGSRQIYQLPLVVRPRATPQAVLAQIESTSGDGLLFDAVEDAAFLRHLADAFAHGVRFDGKRSRWIVEPVGQNPLVVPIDASIAVMKGEQSNTSIRFANEGIAKLFRRIEPGQNPDVEIGRFLTTKTDFPFTPALYGIATFEDHADGGTATTISGMLQEFLPGSVDVWSFVTRKEEGGARKEEGGARKEEGPSIARRLGEVTRALHDALASAEPDEPDFVPEAATPSDVAAWARATEAQVTSALDLLDRQLAAERIPAQFVDGAQRIAARRHQFLSRVREIADAVRGDAGAKIRHHGDYHLGQVLRTGGGELMIIDFEGEPSKPIEERRRKHSALRDVAGMLRSFGYAGATIEGSGRRAEGEWEREARERFLAGYLDASAARGKAKAPASRPPSPFLPTDRSNIERLIALFEMEKVFYELAYELNNRPDWVWIPMRSIED